MSDLSDKVQKTVSEAIADYALSFRLDDAPEAVLSHGRMLLLDTFGVAMSCVRLPHAEAIASALRELGSAGQATLWGSRERFQLPDAALYNAALIHGADYDDTHVASIVHPSAAVVSTAVTVGERTGATGREVYEAIVAGWEIIVRLGLAARGGFHDVGFHGTGIVSPFAAACVAAKLLKLPRETLVNALGICGSQSAALQEFLNDGTWVKKFHPGWGAHSAIYALLVAKGGFTGPARVFEGGFGMWKTHLGTAEGFEEVLADLGQVYRTTEITFKMYPVCHMTHSFIDCMLALRRQGVKPEEIESIECRIEPRCHPIVCEPAERKKRPDTDYMMRFSLPYVVAVAAVHGKMSPWEVDMKYAGDPQIQDLMDRVTCISDEEKRNPGYFPGWLRLTTKDGRVFTEDRRYELGAPQNPIGLDDVHTKFENNLGDLYSDVRKKRIVELIEGFDRLAGMSELIEGLRIE